MGSGIASESWRAIDNGLDRPHVYSLTPRRIGDDVTPISKDDHHLPFLTGEALQRAKELRKIG